MGNSKRTAGIVSPGLVKTALPPPAAAAPVEEEKTEKGEKVRTTCLHSQLHKTKLCSYHLKGNCQYGTNCAFAHSCTELQATPDLRKTRLCLNYTEGEGCNDPECPFAHGKEELRSTDMFYKKTLCIWNEKGKCRNGDQCRFAHGIGELRASLQQAAVKTRAAKAEKGQAAEGPKAGAPPGGAKPRRPRAPAPGAGDFGAGQGGAEPMKVLPHSSLVGPGMPAGMPAVASMPLPQGHMQAELENLRNHISALSMRCSEIKMKQQMLAPEAMYPPLGDWASNDMVNQMNAKVAAMLLAGGGAPMGYDAKDLQGGGVGQMIPMPPGFGENDKAGPSAAWMQGPPVYPAMGA